MRIIAVICLLIAFRSFSQTSVIKVRKPLSQVDAPWHVTLCGMYRGDVKKEDLYKNKQLIISNNTIGLIIKSYTIIYRYSGGKMHSLSTTGDSLSLDLRKTLLTVDKNTKVFIDDIKAVSKDKDTVFLNPITLKVID